MSDSKRKKITREQSHKGRPGDGLDKTIPNGIAIENNDRSDQDEIARHLHEVRRQRLRELVDRMADGTIKDWCDMSGMSPSFIGNVLNGHKNLGERAARSIEKSLDLMPGFMDIPPGAGDILHIYQQLRQLDEKHYPMIRAFFESLRNIP